jgi:hypothetical protein
MFSVKTPDNTSIRFEYLSENEGRAMLKEGFYKTLPSDQLDFFKRKAYVLSNNQILYELLGKCYYLLNNISDYLKMLRGNKYYNASIIVDNRNKELYSTFYLNPQSGYEYFQKKVKQLEKYPVLEGYHTYLMPDGSIAYLRHRVNNLYDGYWYPTLKVFEHEYYLLTSNKYSPNVKL